MGSFSHLFKFMLKVWFGIFSLALSIPLIKNEDLLSTGTLNLATKLPNSSNAFTSEAGMYDQDAIKYMEEQGMEVVDKPKNPSKKTLQTYSDHKKK